MRAQTSQAPEDPLMFSDVDDGDLPSAAVREGFQVLPVARHHGLPTAQRVLDHHRVGRLHRHRAGAQEQPGSAWGHLVQVLYLTALQQPGRLHAPPPAHDDRRWHDGCRASLERAAVERPDRPVAALSSDQRSVS